jgi:hypothetical protein
VRDIQRDKRQRNKETSDMEKETEIPESGSERDRQRDKIRGTMRPETE